MDPPRLTRDAAAVGTVAGPLAVALGTVAGPVVVVVSVVEAVTVTVSKPALVVGSQPGNEPTGTYRWRWWCSC